MTLSVLSVWILNQPTIDNGRGGTICYFSVNIRDRFPGHMVLDAFCHNKAENNFENFENKFLTPPTRGLKNRKNSL